MDAFEAPKKAIYVLWEFRRFSRLNELIDV